MSEQPPGAVAAAPAEPTALAGPDVDHLGGALTALVFGGGLVALASQGALPLLAGVAVCQAVLIPAWVLGTRLPGRIGGLLIGGLAAAGADVVVSRWPTSQLGTLLPVLVFVVPVLFLHQLARGVVRLRVVESLSSIALLVVPVVAVAALPLLRHETDGGGMAVAVLGAMGGALLVGHLVDMLWAEPRFDEAVSRGLLAVVVAVAVGAAVGYLGLRATVEFSAARAAFLGGAVALVVSLFAVGTGFVQRVLAAPQERAARLPALYGVLLPLALVAPVAYLLCLAIRV